MKTCEQRTQSILQKAAAKKAKRNRTIKITSAVSGALALMLAVNLVLFVPYQTGGVDISAYKNDAYYPIIQRLNDTLYAPYKTNNFVRLMDAIFGGLNFGSSAPDLTPPDMPEDDGNYDDVTLNQTENVTEGDLFKRTQSHIFYLGFTRGQYDVMLDDNGDKIQIYTEPVYLLRAYSLDGESSQKVAEYVIEPESGTSFLGYADEREMFVGADGKSVTVLTPCFDNDSRLLYTAAIRLDISDISDIKETGRIYVSGRYVSSRATDGSLLLVSDFSVFRRETAFSDAATFLPQIGARGALKTLPVEDIIMPDGTVAARYTVICSLDEVSLEPTDAVALLSYSDDVYVSQNNLFAMRGFTETYRTNNEYKLEYSLDKTEIRIVSYGGGKLENEGAVTVDGDVLDRYSLDEYGGNLRVFSTATYRATSYSYTYGNTDPYKDKLPAEICNFYCFDINSREMIASVENFAPVGESVKSARFYGDTAYVCTAEIKTIITDPVFAFDLSDYANIKYTDTGTIPGYSLSLNEFAFDSLIGIGYGDSSVTLKIELYESNDTAVTPITKYELENVLFSSIYKAHFIDKNNGLAGLAVTDIASGAFDYKLLRYDGYELKEVLSVPLDTEHTDSADDVRATYIDGYMYIFDNGGLSVKQI